MATFIVLGNFTDQGIRNIKESPERTETLTAFSAGEFGKILGKMP